MRGLALAMPEPIGVIGVACPDEFPLLASSRWWRRRSPWATPSLRFHPSAFPLSATDLYQVLETSDVPAGMINIVTGERNALAGVLAEHDDVDAIWYFGDARGAAEVQRASAGNMKRTRVRGPARRLGWAWGRRGEEFLREATQVKNIWVPYGA